MKGAHPSQNHLYNTYTKTAFVYVAPKESEPVSTFCLTMAFTPLVARAGGDVSAEDGGGRKTGDVRGNLPCYLNIFSLLSRHAFPVFINAISGIKITRVPMESRFPAALAHRIFAQQRVFPVFIPDIFV
jgi:hypothetical protein